jgi:hypothetical protein
MARRTKREMELMKDDATYYLLQTNNDHHKAYDLFIKEHLEVGQSLPYYIKSNKDFLIVSQELAIEWNRKEQMKKADKERFESKQTVINFIINLSVNELKEIYKQYKDNVPQSDKLVLMDVYMMKAGNDFQEKYIDQQMINVFQTIYREIKQPA